MASTAYLWSAAALLVAALAVGNPLRPAVVAASVASPRTPLAVEAVDRPAARAGLGVPSPAAVSLVRHGGAPAVPGYDACPDAELASQVTGAMVSAVHGTVWLLRDGRCFVRGAGANGLPLVELTVAPAK